MTAPDSWEERMAARATARRLAREAEEATWREAREQERAARIDAMGVDWLNGWPRTAPDQVTIGNGVCCIGCGRLLGVFSIAITGDEVYPDGDPDWPLTRGDCWICQDTPA